MARGALQVISDGPVILVAEFVLDQIGDGRRYAAQLSMAEGVLQA